MFKMQKHTILLITILLWSCVSVFAGEVREIHFMRDSYASGERTVKSSGENAAMFVNAEFAGGTTNTAKFSLYVSPYLVANQGGRYTKHIYIGSQRIVSKLGDLKSYGADPRRIEYAGSESDGPKVDYKTKYALQQQVIKDNFAHFDVPYNGADNNDYVDGKGFSERDGSLKSAMLKAAMAKEGNKSAGLKDNFQQGDSYEQYQYFYHPDHLGSSSFITNTEGEVVQHIEYVPYGEVFIEERNNVWNTPYLFNAKEFDEETGLYYYGARYYDSRLAIFYTTDRYAEKYPWQSAYSYAGGNPIKFIDVNGDSIMARVNGNDYKYDLEHRCFIDINGCNYEEDNMYIVALSQALQTLSESETGNCLLTELCESSSNVVICESWRNSESEVKNDMRYNSRVLWNSKKDAAFGGGAFISLGHELAHTLDRFSGTMDMGTWFVTPEGKKIPNAEKFSTFIENKIRYENNLPLRRAYAVDNNRRPCAGWILDSKNRSVHFDKQGDISSKHIKRRNRYVFR